MYAVLFVTSISVTDSDIYKSVDEIRKIPRVKYSYEKFVDLRTFFFRVNKEIRFNDTE